MGCFSTIELQSIGVICAPKHKFQLEKEFAKAPNSTTGSEMKSSKQETITFAGYSWHVRDSDLSNPGPNHWSCSCENVWVDDKGWLHLKIAQRNGKWYSSELSTIQPLGHGKYTFHVDNSVYDVDKNVVLGLFAYKDDEHEVDIEFSRWGNLKADLTWFTVQPRPYITGYNTYSSKIKLNDKFSTHSFLWSQEAVFFKSLYANHSAEKKELTVNSFTSPVRANAVGAKAFINLWLFQGKPPSDRKDVEIVIRNFKYTPEENLEKCLT